MTTKTELWLKGAAAALVSGICTSFLNALGISGAQMIGVKIDQLKPGQLLATAIIGGLIGLAAYLKQSPVPPEG